MPPVRKDIPSQRSIPTELGSKGRKAVVTAADSGIGWHTATLLVAEGATVVVSDIDQGRLAAAAGHLEAVEG